MAFNLFRTRKSERTFDFSCGMAGYIEYVFVTSMVTLNVDSDSLMAFQIFDWDLGIYTVDLAIRGFPKIDHSGIDASIVLAKKLPLTGLEPSDKLLISCIQSHALLTRLSGQVLTERSLTQLSFVHQLTFELKSNWEDLAEIKSMTL